MKHFVAVVATLWSTGVASALDPSTAAEASSMSSLESDAKSSMRPREVEAFRSVAEQCRRDVQYYCDDEPPPAFGGAPFLLRIHRGGSPFHSSSSLRSSPSSSSSFLMVEEPQTMLLPDLLLQSAMDSLFEEEWPMIRSGASASAKRPCNRMAAQGGATQDEVGAAPLLGSDAQVPQVARRRLLESDASSAADPNPPAAPNAERLLPFDRRSSQCLHKIYKQRLVRPECGQALARLQMIRTQQQVETEARYREQVFVLKHVLMLYGIILLTLLVLYGRRSSEARRKRRQKIKILRAVYSTPALRLAVERAVRESIGTVPPLRWRALHSFGRHGRDFKNARRQSKVLWLAALVVGMAFVSVAPLTFLPVCVGLAGMLLLVSVLSDAPPEPVCACCCCGGTTLDAKRGTLTDDQACCGCCNGTGVCAPSCVKCCGNDGSNQGFGCCCGGSGGCCGGGGGCCGSGCCGGSGCCSGSGCCGSCCCCSKGGENAKPKPRPHPHPPKPDDCTCCCCGGSRLDAERGMLTDEQACCSCCKGTGVCSPACDACCHGKGCDCCCCCSDGCCCGGGDKTETPDAELAIYEAVPIQIV